MLPPWPPSPPSGPPLGTYFSRRKLRQPLPPLPASTMIEASSTNCICHSPDGIYRHDTRRPCHGGAFLRQGSGVSGRDDADELAVLRTLGLELDHTVVQGEQGVVAAEADAGAGVELGAALTHDDVAGGDGLATEQLDAKALGF